MSCQTVQKSLSAFVDDGLSGEARSRVSQHLARCRECAARSQELAGVRQALRGLPVRMVPSRLASRLQVLALRESSRRVAHLNRWHHLRDRFSLLIDNLMRPVAIPLVGGLSSALFLFSILTPALTITWDARHDVPATDWLYTEARLVQVAPFNFHGDEAEVILTIDANGQISNYSAPEGRGSRAMIDNVGNNLLFSSFQPATMFGKPMSGKIRVSFKKVGDRIVVRG